MPIFYRGDGVGTYWHENDARLSGFTSQSPGIVPSIDRLMHHIARGMVNSPYISLTRDHTELLTFTLLSLVALERQRPILDTSMK